MGYKAVRASGEIADEACRNVSFAVVINDNLIAHAKREMPRALAALSALPDTMIVDYFAGDVLLISQQLELSPADEHFDLLLALTQLQDGQALHLKEFPSDLVMLDTVLAGSLYLQFSRESETVWTCYVEDDSMNRYWISEDTISKLIDEMELPVDYDELPEHVLSYPVEVRQLPEEYGGGYIACVPYLGRWTFQADGETPQEAIDRLQELYRSLVAEGKRYIPMPPTFDGDL